MPGRGTARLKTINEPAEKPSNEPDVKPSTIGSLISKNQVAISTLEPADASGKKGCSDI